jgi:hypothetical protein
MTSSAHADVDFRMDAAPQGDQELLFEIKVCHRNLHIKCHNLLIRFVRSASLAASQAI